MTTETLSATTTTATPLTASPSGLFPLDAAALPGLNNTLVVNPLAALALVGASSQPLTDLIPTLDEVDGTFTIANGFVTANLATPFGPLTGTYDVVSLATEFNTTFQGATGTLNLADGVATGNLAIADETYTGSFEFAQLVGGFVSSFLSDLDGSVAFENGKIAVDVPTPFGAIAGTVDFSSGKLVSDLETPFGPLDFAIDFPESAQYNFTAGGLPLTVNLDTGLITADLVSSLPGPELSLPLSALSGDLSFANGAATLNLATTFGSFSVPFEFAATVGDTLTDFLTAATGTLTVDAGNLGANLVTPLGDFAGVFPAGQLVTDLIATLPDYNGTLTLGDGTITAALTTPYGPVNETYDYGQYLDGLASLIDGLDLAIAV